LHQVSPYQKKNSVPYKRIDTVLIFLLVKFEKLETFLLVRIF